MSIELSKRQSIAWHYLEDKTTNEILYGGGAGGGKSMLGCIWHIHRRLAYPKSRGVIARRTLKDIEESTLVTLFNVCEMMGYVAGVHYNYNQQKNTITWIGGSKTILKELKFYPQDPDFHRLGSTEYTDVFIDEANEVRFKAFEILKTRIRYKMKEFNLVPKIFVTCNPGPGWIKDRFVKKDNEMIALENDKKFIPALVTDNPDEEFVNTYKRLLEGITDDYDRLRLLNGDWDAEPKSENPFFIAYDPKRHESRDAIFQPHRQIYFSIDFNINPFCLILSHIWKDERGYHVHIFDEIAIEAGSIPKLCEIVKAKYGVRLPYSIWTGDHMGNRKEISQRDNSSNYLQMRRLMNLTSQQLKLVSNPTHRNSRADCNYVLANHPDFKINPVTCPGVSRDMKTVKCNEEGGIIKKDRHQLDQRADFGDGVRYLINTFLKQWLLMHQKIQKSNTIPPERSPREVAKLRLPEINLIKR